MHTTTAAITSRTPTELARRLVTVRRIPHPYERSFNVNVLVVGGVELPVSGHDREALEIVAASIRAGIVAEMK